MTEPGCQGDVTIYHFPGVFGGLGWGWRHSRFFVLEHGVLLVYGKESDWSDHRKPLYDIVLSRDSSVELNCDGPEALVVLSSPTRKPLIFSGRAEGDDGVDLTSEEWCQKLHRAIGTLVAEVTNQPRNTSSSRRRWRISIGPVGLLSGRVKNGIQARASPVGGNHTTHKAVLSESHAYEAKGNENDGNEEERDRREANGQFKSEAGEVDDDDIGRDEDEDDEEEGDETAYGLDIEDTILPALSASSSSGSEEDDLEGTATATEQQRGNMGSDTSRKRNRSRISDRDIVTFRRWSSHDARGVDISASVSTNKRGDPRGDDINEESESRDEEDEDSDDERRKSSLLSLRRHGDSDVHGALDGGGLLRRLWRKTGLPFNIKDPQNCSCTWCAHPVPRSNAVRGSSKMMNRRLSNSYGSKCATWRSSHQSLREKVSPVVSRLMSKYPPAYDLADVFIFRIPPGTLSILKRRRYVQARRWEYLVGRWVALQLAREGDILGIKRFLNRYPHFSDKNNLLRAAVRYKQYALVEYFLEEQKMDVNLVNTLGMPLVWFSVVYMQRGDSGVMLRYLQQKGANIKSKNSLGQSVLFIVVSSRGKEAIPTLEYLVDHHGLSLTERDVFGSQPLHWAVLFGHMDTVQWISERTAFGGDRADWAAAFDKMEKIRLVRPEHTGAVRSWRIRGLQRSARSVTPLGVAVLHNHEAIAKYLMGFGMEDAPCIQQKRANIFKEKNSDLALIAKTWPDLLPGVLSGFERQGKRENKGMSWDEGRSLATPTGWSENTYDVRLLYGLPEVPTNRNPLNIFLSTGHPLLFECKVVQLVIALKWSVFGHRYYIWELGRYIALTLCFIAGFILWGHATDLTEPVGSQAIAGTLTRVSCWILTLYNLLVEEGREFRAAKTARKYLLGGWNLQSIVAYVLVLSLIVVYKPWSSSVSLGYSSVEGTYSNPDLLRRMMTAPAALLLFTRFTEHLAIWRSTGIFIAVIRMMIVDTASWAVLFILFQVAFSFAFFSLLCGEDEFVDIWDTMTTVFIMSMGEINVPFTDNPELHMMGMALFVIFMLLVAVVYLNLLVAMMTAGYDKVVKGATAQAMMNRAAALVKWEGIMDEKTRVKCFQTVAPGKGKRSHITLKGWFDEGSTEVFVDEEGATAVELIQKTRKKHVNSHSMVMDELVELRSMMESMAKRRFPRVPPEDSFSSSSDQDTSFRKRQAGMLDASGQGLSRLKLGGTVHTNSTLSVSAEEMKEWREKAREVEKKAHSRRGVVRAQALIRGHLSRSKNKPKGRYLQDNPEW